MTLLGWVLCAALGADEPDVEVQDEEIVVYGELRVKEAREKVVADLEALGFTRIKDKGDRLVLRHEKNWKGKAVLHDDGRLDFRRQSPEGTMPDTFFKDASPLVGWVPCIVVPTACVKVGGWVVSKRKLEHVQIDAARAVETDLQQLSERQADLAIDRKLDTLEARLLACWNDGVPMEGDASLPTPADRRRHLLAFWASRTDTVWGERVREPVAAFLRHVVQDSEHPVTAEELAAVNQGREGLPPLDLPLADR